MNPSINNMVYTACTLQKLLGTRYVSQSFGAEEIFSHNALTYTLIVGHFLGRWTLVEVFKGHN